MSVTDNIAIIAPALATDTRIPTLIIVATNQISSCRFGRNYEWAIALLVCHMISRNPAASLTGGTPGAVTNAQEGAVSQSYSVSPDLQKRYSDWTSTPYGCQLAQLAESSVVAPMAVGGAGAPGPLFI